MARGVSRPPAWALIVMVVGAVVLIVGLPLAMGRGQLSQAEVGRLNADVAAREAAESAQATERAPDRILVIGDSYTGGSDEGGNGAAGWARLAAADLTSEGYDLSLDVAAAGGSGYVAVGPTGSTFVDLARKAGGDYDVVVFFGSRNDTATGTEVAAAADEAYAAVRASSPHARLLVIGPPWVDSDFPANVERSRDALASTVEEFDATFVDPLEEDWFGGEFKALIGADEVHPTDEGHEHLADLIRPRLQQALDAPTS